MSKIIGLFPGQGSQALGMGQTLAKKFSPAQVLLNQADEILGISLSTMMFEGPESDLKATQNTQPALFVCSMMVNEFLKSEGITFDFVAGHSLGEYSAICAAGGLSFEDGLKLVRLRGELMASAGAKAPGAMAAVLGLADEDLIPFLEKSQDAGPVVAANFNCPGQIVISGAEAAVAKASELIAAEGKRVVQLPVSGAFHSPLMNFAVEGLKAGISNTKFNNLNIPLIANVNAAAVTQASDIQGFLVDQLTSSVLWTKSMEYAVSQDVTAGVEVGSGKVLMGLMRKISREVKVIPAEDPASVEKVKGLLL